MAQVPQPYLTNFDFGQRISQAIEGGLQRKQEREMQQAQIAQRESEFLRNMINQQQEFGKNYLLAKDKFEFEKQKINQDQAYRDANAPEQIDYNYGGKTLKLTADEIQSLRSAEESKGRLTQIYNSSQWDKISKDPRIQALQTNYQNAYKELLDVTTNKDRFQNFAPADEGLLRQLQYNVNSIASELEQTAQALGMPPSKSLVQNAVRVTPLSETIPAPSTTGIYMPPKLSPTAQQNQEAIKANNRPKFDY